MKKNLVTTIALLALSLPGSAQYIGRTSDYALYRNVTLAAAAAVMTVQMPASNAPRVQLLQASFYCSVACTVTLERDGTAATATAQTPVAISNGTPATTVTGWIVSNVGTGTVIRAYNVAAGEEKVIDISSMVMLAAGTGNNVTLRTSSITGQFIGVIKWRDQ